jgi:hypothetical protein
LAARLPASRKRGPLEEDTAADMLTLQASGGFSVDASVRVERDDRAGVERSHPQIVPETASASLVPGTVCWRDFRVDWRSSALTAAAGALVRQVL